MPEQAEPNAEPAPTTTSSTTKSVKDKACPYCGQVFTSSSLGRHLDLYIKEKNPKPPDGVHDVEEIRKVRGGITRRHPRNSLARRDTLTPVGTPTTTATAATSRKSPGSDAESSGGARSPAVSKTARDAVAGLNLYAPRWETTGVINDIPGRAGGRGDGEGPSEQATAAKRPVPARSVSRQVVKAQFDMKQKVQDALDTSRAAELALREILSSWRAAKTQIDIRSMPFDFDPLSLDFPALALQCLQPPPTLFSSTQHPTPTSWSISAPGPQQFEALKTFFREEFRKWSLKCTAATTAMEEELRYPPKINPIPTDSKHAIKTAEDAASSLEQQVTEHLQSAYAVWEGLPPQRRTELWTLELARGVGRRQTETAKLREAQHSLRQENAALKAQIEQLSRLQQPREYKIMSPALFPISEAMMDVATEQGLVHGRRAVALSMEDRHEDLNALVTKSIERWKNVIVTARSANAMSSQRPLDQVVPASPATACAPTDLTSPRPGLAPVKTNVAAGASTAEPVPTPAPTPTTLQHKKPPPLVSNTQPQNTGTSLHQAPKTPGYTNTSAPDASARGGSSDVSPPIAPATTAPIPPSQPPVAPVDETSDLDADAEMEDDYGYEAMNTPVPKPPLPTAPVAVPATASVQQQAITPKPEAIPKLDVKRTRGPAAQRALAAKNGVAATSYRSASSHATMAPAGVRGARGAHLSLNRSATNFHPAAAAAALQKQNRGGGGNFAEFAISQQQQQQQQPDVDADGDVGGGDPMYMD